MAAHPLFLPLLVKPHQLTDCVIAITVKSFLPVIWLILGGGMAC